jgi:acetyl-CoA carboxylase carboxyltransferase component
VLAGTQGLTGHRKKDRLFEIVERLHLPVVFFAEGGGGRPGDTDYAVASSLDTRAFALWARLSGLVFRLAVVSGRCFAGNAAIAGCSDLVIATDNAAIGMGGPAMIEAAGLGTHQPEQIGPAKTQSQNGTVDLRVRDEAEAVNAARKLVSYFQGSVEYWECEDQRLMRTQIPENRLRTYDVKSVVHTLADKASMTELRSEFAPGMVTALIRIEGHPLGVIANNPTHLAGAITSEGSDKAARFVQLCDTHNLPIVSLIDTPGIMVGPDAEKHALVRHSSRLFVAGASITVPFVAIVLRKGYGLGAQAMASGSFHEPLLTVAWPTGEVGPMGLEGAVRLGYRRELDAISDPDQRQAKFEEMVNTAYAHSKGLNAATHFEIDDVIDPADSRKLIMNVIRCAPQPAKDQKKRGFVDTW